MLLYVRGNLLKSDCDIIGHGCNCFNTMGAGIALQIKLGFPEIYLLDKNTIYGDKKKLGTIIFIYSNDERKIVVNCYTQYTYSNKTKKMSVNYDAIEKCMKEIKRIFSANMKIGFPKIGAGLAGGNWEIISKLIDNVFTDRDVYIYELDI